MYRRNINVQKQISDKDTLQQLIKTHRQAANKLQMEDANIEVKRPFHQEAKLAEKSKRLATLNVVLNIGGKDKPSAKEQKHRDGALQV